MEQRMQTKTSFVVFFLGMLIVFMAVATVSQPAGAQTQTCYDQQGLPIECTPQPGQSPQPPGRKKPSKTPTNIAYQILTKTSTPTLTALPTETARPPAQDMATSTGTSSAEVATANPTSAILVPVRTVGPSMTPPSVICLFCAQPTGPQLVLGGGLLLFLLLGLGLLIYLLFTGPLNLGTSGLPAGGNPIPGGNESATMTVRNAGDFGGGNESATMTVRDAGDFGGGNESATMTVRNAGDFGGGNESATMTVRDAGNFGGGNESATIGGKDINELSPDAMRSVREAAEKALKSGNRPGGTP
jgi:hypothetical protein